MAITGSEWVHYPLHQGMQAAAESGRLAVALRMTLRWAQIGQFCVPP